MIKEFFRKLLQIGNELVKETTTSEIKDYYDTKEFNSKVGLTGIVLTKLDGTAKGGVVIGIADQFHIPVKFIGVGEKIEDLQVFDKKEFVASLFKN